MRELTPEQQTDFENAENCAFCGKSFEEEKIKCHHHSHADGAYIAALCLICNFCASASNEVTVLVHNLNFDLCFFIRFLSRFAQKEPPFIVAPTGQKIRFLKFPGSLVFADSLQFLNASLEKLVEEHKQSNLPFSF